MTCSTARSSSVTGSVGLDFVRIELAAAHRAARARPAPIDAASMAIAGVEPQRPTLLRHG